MVSQNPLSYTGSYTCKWQCLYMGSITSVFFVFYNKHWMNEQKVFILNRSDYDLLYALITRTVFLENKKTDDD